MSGTRRDVLAGASGAMLLVAGAPLAAAPVPGSTMVVKRIYSEPSGASAVEVLNIAPPRKPLPAIAVLTAALHTSTTEDWHVTPEKFIIVTLAGAHAIKVSNGRVVTFGPGEVAYLEDLTGKGHQNSVTADGAVLLFRMPADFDIKAWAA